jgi:hypothetical protein
MDTMNFENSFQTTAAKALTQLSCLEHMLGTELVESSSAISGIEAARWLIGVSIGEFRRGVTESQFALPCVCICLYVCAQF